MKQLIVASIWTIKSRASKQWSVRGPSAHVLGLCVWEQAHWPVWFYRLPYAHYVTTFWYILNHHYSQTIQLRMDNRSSKKNVFILVDSVLCIQRKSRCRIFICAVLFHVFCFSSFVFVCCLRLHTCFFGESIIKFRYTCLSVYIIHV